MIARNSIQHKKQLNGNYKIKKRFKKFIYCEKLTSASNSNISGAPCSVYATIHSKIQLVTQVLKNISLR